ncbi:sigma 54-interacting transcriptional regulator [uncultured Oscillibacter sp.]|uniref:sigma 54-interacting transcriptional regulator n=1 Tax=uncultured Oscillibacter sp. TaxID=876091 RepID=UPI00262CF0A0|nr:sigma 54-interacting transcriptional regulator [uncultured Oscillibacter sp.]
MDMLQSVMEASSQAMFTLDREGTITHINHQTKDYFGLFNHSRHSHGPGRLEPGDLVIIADTAIGSDDGNLSPADLERLNIHDRKLRAGDRIAAVSLFDSPEAKPVYKFLPGGDSATLELSTVWQDIPIRVSIDGRAASVTVGETVYTIDYFWCIGQLVVLDGNTGQVKFWEEKGYSARKEGIGNLLRGAPFVGKSPGSEIRVTGYYFREFFEGALFERHLEQVMTGQAPEFRDMPYEINGYELVASILPVTDSGGALSGVIVKFRNIEDIRVTIQERNNAIKSAERRYREREQASRPEESDFAALFGGGAATAEVRHRAYKLSQLDCNVLITGESGTGKSYMARAFAQAQPRKGAFVTVDCSTIAPSLFESEMFGYAGGAFTGADPKGRVGFFEEADGGTIFLDEIGEIPLDVQAKLLRAIQDKVVCRVGSTRLIPVNVRILAATNCNLREKVAAGQFRQDLYYRLSAFSLELPSLRNCQEDVYFLIDHLMEKILQKYDMPKKVLSGEAVNKLLAYDWPGNIRELENVLESAVALSESDIIYAEHIRLEQVPLRMTLRQRLRQEEEKIIRQTLAQCGGSRARAMEELGLSKTVFYGKLKEYQIE